MPDYAWRERKQEMELAPRPSPGRPESPVPAAVAWVRGLIDRSGRGPYVWDVLLAVFLLVTDLVESLRLYALLRPVGEIASLPVLLSIVILRGALLAFRRRFPLTVCLLIIATLISVPLEGLSVLLDPAEGVQSDVGWWPRATSNTASLEVVVALYTVAALRGRKSAALAAAWAVVATLLWLIPQVVAVGPAPYLHLAVFVGLALYLGDVRRRTLIARAEVAARTRRIAEARAREAEEAVHRERERVAADLQALVERNLERMVGQAGRARDAVETQGGSAPSVEAIGAIERTGRAALNEARRALGLLREDGGTAPLEPVIGVARRVDIASSGGRGAGMGSEWSPSPRSSRRPTRGDAVLAGSLFLFLVSEIGVSLGLWPQEAVSLLSPTDIVAILGLTLPLLFRRAFPLPAALVVASAFGVHSTAGHFLGLAGIYCLLAAVYSVWAERGARQGVPAVLAAAASVLVAAEPLWVVFSLPLTTVYIALLPGASFLGWQERNLRENLRRLEEQEAVLRRLAEADVERARTEERLRIARELHDLTAHSLALMTIQAGAARTVLGSRPEQALAALGAVEDAGRRARAELQDMFAAGVLERNPDPPPGIESLPVLARRMEDAGLEIDLDVDRLPSLSPGLDLSLYRIVQEALTNAAKHAGPTRIRIHLSSDGNAVSLEVADEGPSQRDELATTDARNSGERGGRGLIGMRERVRAFGGVLNAGHGPTGGFAVSVRVPLSVEASATGP
jgi:signal transduction histidine kinase